MKVTDMKPTKTAIYLSTILFAAALPSFAAEISNWKGGASGIWGVGYESNWDTYPDSTRYAKFGSPSSEPITVTVDETVEAYGVVISSGRTADLFFTGNGMLKNYRSQLIQTSSSIVTDWNINVTNINGNSALNIYGTNVFHKVLDCSDVYTFSVKDNAKVTLCDSAQLIGQHMTLAAGSSFECLDSSVSELTKDLKCSPGSSLKVADNSVLAVRGMWLPFTQQEGVDEEWTMEGGEIRSVGTNGLVLPYTNATKTVSGTGTLYAYKFSVDNASNLVIRLIGPKAYLGHTWFDGGDTRNIIFEVGGGSTLGAYGQDLYFQYWTNKVVGTVTVDTIDYADKSTPRTIAMSKFFDCNGTITVNGTGTFMINETITQPNLGLTVKDSATLGQVSWGSAYALGDIVLEDSARFDVPKHLGHKTTPNCVKSITMRDDTTLTVPRYVQASGDVVLSGNASAVICNSSNDSGAALSCANLSLADNASLSVTGTIAATSLTMSGNSHLAFTAGTAIEAGAAFGAGNWTMEITIPSGYEAGIRPVVIGAGFEGDFADHVTLVGDTEGWSARTLNGNLIIYKGPLPPMLIVECETATVQAPVCEAGGMFRSAAQVSVRLSQAYDHPLVVTITPGFENGASANWGDYVRFSTTTSEVSVLPPADPPTVIIPANSTDKQTLFLYALRSDYNTIGPGSQIILTPSFDDSAAADVITEFSIAGLWISAAKPIITSPGPGSAFDTAINAEIDLEVSVEDTYADMHDTTTGYTVRIKKTAVEGLTTLPERYRVDEYGNLVGLSSGSYPKLTFDAPGNHCPQIMVISPVSGKSSSFVSFNVCVEDPAVHVGDPVVQISTPEWLNETDTNQYVQIGVAYWEDSVLTARVEVAEYRQGRDNPGVLKLDSAYASQLPGEDNVYYVELRDGSAAIAIESMDGTADSSICGFTIRASIVSSDINYIPAQERVCIYNVAPVCDVTPENSTAWNVVIGGTPTNSIHWQVSRDAAGDFAGTTSFPGIKVSFWGDCLNAQTFYVTEPSSGVFTPDLGSGMGYQVVYLTIEDKDGAGQYWTYQYEVGYPMETVDGISWCYWINDGKASIEYGSKGDLSGDITIPATIGGCPVTSIGWSAFEGYGDIVSVTIPEGVASIKDDAFRGCSSLVTVKIPDSVTSVGQLAFDGCNNALYDTTTISGAKLVDGWAIGATESLACDLDLTGVRGVGAYAFSNCSGITSLTIPIQYTGGIAANAFDGCINVTNLMAASCPQGLDRRKITHLTIPEGVEGIMPSAFEGCSALASVSIPNSVIWINNSVFRGCSALANVSIPNSVTTVGAYAFAGCTSLTNVVFEGNAPTCGDGAFEGCSSECVVLVPPGSTGWGVDIPGTWKGVRIEYIEVGIVLAQEQIDGDGNITGIVVNNPTATIGSVKTPWMILRPDGESGFANDFTTNAIAVVSEDGTNYYAHVEGENGDRTKVIHFTVNESGIPSKHGDVIDTTNSGEDNNAEEMKKRKLIGVKDGYLHFFPVDEAGSSLSYNPETGDKFERGKSYPMKFLASDEKGTVVLVNNLWKSESGRTRYVTEFLRIKENGIVESSTLLFPALSEDIKRTVIYDDSRRCFYVGDSEGNIYHVASNYSDLMTTLPVPVTGLSCNAGNESGIGEEFFATSTKTNAFFNIHENQYNVAREYVKGGYYGYPKPMVPKTNDGLIKIIDNRRNGGKFLCVTTKGIIAVGD